MTAKLAEAKRVPRPVTLAERVRTACVETLARQQPTALLGNLGVSLLFALALAQSWSGSWLSIWLAAVWVTSAFRGLVWWRYRRGLAGTETGHAAWLLTLGSAASGLLWGIVGAFFAPIAPEHLSSLAILVLGGMTAGAAATLASYYPAFVAFAAFTLIPAMLSLLESGQMVDSLLGLMVALYFALLAVAALHLNRTLRKSLALQFEKSDLAEILVRERLKAEAASMAKSAFLATVTHELRTPLNAIIGFAEMMRDGVMGPLGHSKYQQYSEDIHRSGEHLLALINDLLDASRAELGRLEVYPQPLDAPVIIEDCLRMVGGRMDHRRLLLVQEVPDEMPPLVADRQRLRQILLNLLTNAIKFTPEGGRITVSARATDSSFEIAVADTGIGMRREELPKALEFFGQLDDGLDRRQQGAGIGLPLSKILMERHGGRLEIRSAPGEGTTVTLLFPRPAEGAQSLEVA